MSELIKKWKGETKTLFNVPNVIHPSCSWGAQPSMTSRLGQTNFYCLRHFQLNDLTHRGICWCKVTSSDPVVYIEYENVKRKEIKEPYYNQRSKISLVICGRYDQSFRTKKYWVCLWKYCINVCLVLFCLCYLI